MARKLILVGAALLWWWSAPTTRGVVLLSDSFSYTNGSLVIVSGDVWVHHSGSTTGELQVVSGKAFLTQTNSEDVAALLAGQPYGATTNIRLYASFTINFSSLPSGVGTYFVHFKDNGTGFRDKIFATTNGVPAGFFRVGVANAANSPSALISSNLSLNTDYTLATRYAPSNATSVLWMNPSAETDPSAAATDGATPLSVATFALRESLSSGDGMGSLYLDNLIAGTSFSDVVSSAPTAPVITNQPQSQTVNEGDNATFTVGASGAAPLSYQWTFYGTNLDGATNSSLSLTGVTTNQAGPYAVTITNSAGSTNSQTATLNVTPTNSAPVIATQPQSQTVTQGTIATFVVAATGAQPLSYQWQFYGTNLDGVTNSTLVLSGVTTDQAGPYTVTVTNSVGSTNSQPATLTVLVPPSIMTQPQSQIATEGNTVNFSVNATGTLPLGYQWQFNSTNLAGATDAALTLTSVTTNQGGPYAVTITNAAGSTSSQPAVLTVNPLPSQVPALSYVTYNMKGNGATNWTTNAPQVQAIGHELAYLSPDVITFNEIPNSFLSDMTNLVATFLPGYNLVIGATDGFIRDGIASRFPIPFFKSYLHSSDLAPYGYTNSNFTRDLLQARVSVPGFAQPLNVFTVHLKSGQDTDSSTKRGAEASAVSNWFVTVYLPTNALQPYTLSGDMNEDIADPPSSNPQSIQHLINAATGLQLTTPLNPFTRSELTFSIQSSGGLTKRYDYIMPCGLLFSNIVTSQVFRTDLLTNPPPPLPLATNDDKTASDHLPVMMVFANPYDKPFRLTSISRSNQNVTLKWESVPGQPYRLEASSNFSAWSVFASNLQATSATYTFSSNVADDLKFFRVYRVP